jgi:hypothetical protein
MNNESDKTSTFPLDELIVTELESRLEMTHQIVCSAQIDPFTGAMKYTCGYPIHY